MFGFLKNWLSLGLIVIDGLELCLDCRGLEIAGSFFAENCAVLFLLLIA